MGGPAVSDEAWRAAHAAGWTCDQVMLRLGCSMSSVYQAEQRLGLRFLRPSEVPAAPIACLSRPICAAERARIAAAYGVAPGLVPATVTLAPQGATVSFDAVSPREAHNRMWRINYKRVRMRALLRREGRL